MNFILGKKVRMTQIFDENGKLIPVTEFSVEPNTILRIKNKEQDAYEAVLLAMGTRNKIKKSLLGLFNKLGKFKYLKEFRIEGQEFNLKVGDQIGLDSFKLGDKVKVTSISKGKGFQGVVKRHGFGGTNEQHGNKDQSRMPGSIGATGPAHVFKGTRMAGRTGGDQITIANLEIVKIDLDNSLLYLKGSCAGGNNSLVSIKGDGELKVYEKPLVEKEQTEEVLKDIQNSNIAQNEIDNEIDNKDIKEDKNTEENDESKIDKESTEVEPEKDNKEDKSDVNLENDKQVVEENKTVDNNDNQKNQKNKEEEIVKKSVSTDSDSVGNLVDKKDKEDEKEEDKK